MSKQETQIVCMNALQLIINNGAKLAQDNRTVKNYLQAYANRNNLCVTNQLIEQTGTRLKDQQQQQKVQEPPSNLKKDVRCFYSVNTSPFKLNSKRSFNNKDSANTKSPGLTRRSSTQTNQKFSKKLKQRQSFEDKFIDLSEIITPPTGKKITQAMINQQKYINSLRENGDSQRKISKMQKQQQIQVKKKDQQRIQQIKNKLHKHLSQKNNNFTFDIDGTQLLFDNENQHISLRRKYPPSNLKYSFDQPEEPCVETQSHMNMNIKQKAARGQAFASAVLKTMNMSKLSLNLTSKTCNIDQFAFMKRNDLFNNNHSRQVTTIPYLNACEGTNYTQANTNVSVSNKKTQRTSHSENKSRFINHKFQHFKQNAEAHNKTQMLDLDNLTQKIQKRRIQSCKPSARPRTSVPLTAKTTDRIISVNQKLQSELLE